MPLELEFERVLNFAEVFHLSEESPWPSAEQYFHRSFFTIEYSTMPQAKTSLITTLKRVPLFKVLSEEEYQLLMRRALHQRFKAHERIFSGDEPCRGLYLIEAGSVKIFGSSTNGREQVLATQGPGGTLGELAAFDGGSYPTSAAATTDSDLLLIKREELQALFARHPEVRVALLELIASRVRPMIGMIERLRFNTVRQRLMAHFLGLATQDGKLTAHGVELTLSSTYRDLAAQIGTVPEVLSRNVGALQSLGLISIRGKTVTLYNPKAAQSKTGS